MRVVIAVLACTVSLWGQGGRRYPVPEEVGRILVMQEDSQGFLWVGSEAGLFRFDGHRFQPVGQWAGLPDERVEVLAIAPRDGALWMGLPSGLYRLGGAKAERVSDRAVSDLLWLGSGLVAAVADQGLVYWTNENGRWISRAHAVSPTPRYLHAMLNSDGVTYAEGRRIKRARWTGDGFQITEIPLQGTEGSWREVVEFPDSVLLAAEKEYGVAQWQGNALVLVQRYPARQGGKLLQKTGPWSALINALTLTFYQAGKQDARQVIASPVVRGLAEGLAAAYLPRSNELLIYHLGGSAIQLDEEFGVVEPRAIRFARDTWLAPTSAGIQRMSIQHPPCQRFPYTFLLCPVLEGAPFHDVVKDGNRRLWAVSREAGVVEFDEKRGIVRTARLPESHLTRHLLGINEAPDGKIFVAAKDALYSLDDAAGQARLTAVPGFGYTASFTTTPHGDLWAVSDTKLARYRDGAWVDVPLPECIPTTNLRTMAVENENSLWLAYRRDVGFTNLLRGGADQPWRCENFASAEGFSDFTAWMRIDRTGKLWRAGRDRVWVTQLEQGRRPKVPEDWVEIGRAEGLTGGEIELYGATEDHHAGLWLATQRGITIFPGGFLRAATAPVVDAVERTGGIDWLSPLGWVNGRSGRVKAIYVAELPLTYGAPSRRPLWRYTRANGEQGEYKPVMEGRISLEDAPADIATIEFQRRDGASLGMFAILPERTPGWRYPMMLGAGVVSLLLLLLYWRYRGTWADRFGLWRDGIAVRLRGRYGESVAPLLLVPGQRLRNRYEVEGLLARGGFSEVHSALDRLEGNRPVAVKALSLENPLRPDYREWMQTRFIEELKALRTVDHPGVVKLLDAWWEDGTPCLAMPLIDGITLRELLKREGKLAPETVARLVRELGSALRAAHRRGVLHGDIKPENILVTGRDPESWASVIIDFGTSRLRQEASLRKQDRFVAGTRHYMAPEQALGLLVEASDVWALGLVTAEMLTGKHRMELPEDWDYGVLQEPLQAAWVADPGRRAANPEAWAESVGQRLVARAGR